MTSAHAFRGCPVCGRDEAEAYLRKGELRLVRCRQCTMIYANPVPDDFASGEYYNRAGVSTGCNDTGRPVNTLNARSYSW